MQGLKTVGLLCVTFVCLAHAAVIEEPSAPAQYEFNYAVNDPTTGDQKDQQETRNGDDVAGYYRTVDSDGFLRTVRYKADAVNGFTAEVVREPVSGAAPAVPVVAKVAPVIKPVVAPAVAPVVPYVAPVPYVASPAPYYFGSSGYPYNYQPYSSGYPYNYQPYSYGYQAYPYGAAYSPYSYSQYAYNGPYSSTVVRK